MDVRDITPVILTGDEEANIERTLARLVWAPEVVIVDSGSRDRTLAIAGTFPNVRVVERKLDDLASQWTFAVGEARTPWVLTLDADYVVPAQFLEEIRTLVDDAEVDGYVAEFDYAVRGRVLRGSLYPPRAVLLRRSRCRFYMDGHTQRVAMDGTTRRLHARITHDDRKPFSRFVERQKRYMRDEAAKIRAGRDLSLASRIRRLRVVAPVAVVIHALFVRGLILDGWPGLSYAWERFVAEVILSRELLRGGDE